MAGDPDVLTLTFNGFAVPLTHVVCGMLTYTHLPAERNGESFIGKERLCPKCHNTKRYCPPESHYFPLSLLQHPWLRLQGGGGRSYGLSYSQWRRTGPRPNPHNNSPAVRPTLVTFMNILVPKYILMYINTL